MMKMTKWMFILTLLLVSCSEKTIEHKEKQLLTLAIGYIPNMQFAPLYVGMTEGFFAEEGIDLKIEYGMGNDILSLVATGHASLALGDADQYLLAKAQALPLTPVYQYYQTSPIAIITFNDQIVDPQDLKGKRIGVSELFGSSYLSLLEFLEYFNISVESVEIVRVGYTQTTALSTGEVDAVVVFANNEPLELAKHKTSYRMWSAEEFSKLAGSIIMANSNDWNDSTKRMHLEAFQRGLTRSISFIRENPELAAEITQQYVDGSNYEDILAGIYATLTFFSENGVINEQQLALTAERLHRLGLIAS